MRFHVYPEWWGAFMPIRVLRRSQIMTLAPGPPSERGRDRAPPPGLADQTGIVLLSAPCGVWRAARSVFNEMSLFCLFVFLTLTPLYPVNSSSQPVSTIFLHKPDLFYSYPQGERRPLVKKSSKSPAITSWGIACCKSPQAKGSERAALGNRGRKPNPSSNPLYNLVAAFCPRSGGRLSHDRGEIIATLASRYLKTSRKQITLSPRDFKCPQKRARRRVPQFLPAYSCQTKQSPLHNPLYPQRNFPLDAIFSPRRLSSFINKLPPSPQNVGKSTKSISSATKSFAGYTRTAMDYSKLSVSV